MGFKELSSFNQALVAKQGWRLIQFPNSLMAKVLQAQYFKKSGFLNAKLGYKPSFIWRSILWGRQVLHNGLRWRIRNGEQVQIYKSNWIPRPTTFKILSTPTLPLETTVSALIDRERKWKENLIRQDFLPEDADQIIKIPLPRIPSLDQHLWYFDKHGNYSSKEWVPSCT